MGDGFVYTKYSGMGDLHFLSEFWFFSALNKSPEIAF